MLSLLSDPDLRSFLINLASSVVWDGAKKSYSLLVSRFRSSDGNCDAALELEFNALVGKSQIKRNSQHLVAAAERATGKPTDQFSSEYAVEKIVQLLSSEDSLEEPVSRTLVKTLSEGGLTSSVSEDEVSRLVAVVLVALSQSDLLPLVQLRTSEATLDAVKQQETANRNAFERVESRLDEVYDAVQQLQTSTTSSTAVAIRAQEQWETPSPIRPPASNGGALTATAEARAINLLDREVTRLEQGLRKELDSSAERLWDEIVEEIRSHNFRQAIEKGGRLRSWLDDNRHNLSPTVHGRALLLLGNIAVTEASEFGLGTGDFSKSHTLLGLAKDVFGSEISEENATRVVALEAKFLAIEGETTKALEHLASRADPQSVMTSLLIRIDDDSTDQMLDALRTYSLDEKWADLAVYAYARNGCSAEAQSAIEWADARSDVVLTHRCRLMRAQGLLTHVCRRQPAGFSVLAMSSQDKVSLKEAVDALQPLLAPLLAFGRIQSGLEAATVCHAYECFRLMGELDSACQTIALARGFRPTPLELGRAALRGDLLPDPSLSQYLREDFPRFFDAHYLAFALDSERCTSSAELLARIQEMTPLAKSDEQRAALGRLVIKQFGADGDLSAEEGNRALSDLVKPDHWLHKLLSAIGLMRKADLGSAARTLEELPQDDALVCQFKAQLELRQGNYAAAAEVLEATGRRMSEPELLLDAAYYAMQATPKLPEIAIRSLEAALVVDARCAEALKRLAFCCVELHGYSRAADCFRALAALESEENLHKLNLAQCLVRTNRADDALAVLDELCGAMNAPLAAHVQRAALLCDLGKGARALANLDHVRGEHWNEPPFVMTYMQAAHAANNDHQAHEGFEQLWALQQRGVVKDVLQPKELQDLIDLGNDLRERRTLLHTELIAGKLPWLFVERLVGNVPYWGWRVRTQQLAWVFDDAQNRAAYSVYSTNSFGALANGAERTLQRVTACDAGTSVVVDLSALITLDRLELLQPTIDLFGTILLPPSYLSEVVAQSGRLRPHQLSQQVTIERIHTAVIRRELLTCDGIPHDAVVIDEYDNGARRSFYGLRDVLDALAKAGRLSGEKLAASANIAHRAAAGTEASQLDTAVLLVISLSTLQTLASHDLLEDLLATFARVYLTTEDLDRVNAEREAFLQVEETQRWHDAMWERLSNHPSVQFKPVLNNPHSPGDDAERSTDEQVGDSEEDDDSEDDAGQISSIAAVLLAQQESVPLLADDRACQNTLLVSPQARAFSSFGSDAVILALWKAGRIDLRTSTSKFLQLLEWRYRFLIMPAPLIVALANPAWFSANSRRYVAKYIHDCMRDAGLFAGAEATTPPSTIALSFYHEWMRNLVEGVVEVWLSDGVSDETATEITEWAMGECLPSPPANLGPAAFKLATLSPLSVLQWALLKLIGTADHARANKILRALAMSAGFSEETYQKTVGDIVNGEYFR